MKVVPVADRDLDRDHLGREVRLDVLEHPLEVGVLLVHHRDEQDARQVQLIADLIRLFGPDLDPGGAAEDDDRGIGRVKSGDHLAEVVEVARGVDQVDLGIQPLGVREPEADGVLAVDFVGGVVGKRGAVLDRSVAAARPRYEGERVHQRRLPATSMADEGHVADGGRAIDFHGPHLPEFKGIPTCARRSSLSNTAIAGC